MERMIARLRARAGVAPLTCLLAMAIALAGAAGESSAPVAGASVKKTVKKLKKQVGAQQQQIAGLEARLAALEGAPSGAAGGDLSGSYPNPSIGANAVNSSKVADDSLTAADIGVNAVGTFEIQNIDRLVHLPLLAFINGNDVAVLDGVPSDGTSPDITRPGNHVEIEWDDNSTGVADNDFVSTNFTVPDDYASDGHYVATIAKDADTGIEERFTCTVVLNEFPGGGQQTATFNITDLFAGRAWFFLDPNVTYAPLDSVALSCRADNGSGGTTANDVVGLEQIEFRYIAQQ